METITQSESSFYELISTIGIPGIVEGKVGRQNGELERLAAINKIPLLYSLACGSESDLSSKHALLINTLTELGQLFQSKGIKYSVFKTLKPFPTTPSDIDVFLPSSDFHKARSLLLSKGYNETASDAYSSTLHKEMIVDLQQQPSVSNIPYLPKSLLIQNTISRQINGVAINTLSPEAELIVIASHSVYKEQMFTLNDYYCITILAEQSDFERVVELASSANVLDAIKIVIALCSEITKIAFGRTSKISEFAEKLQVSNKLLIQDTPIKFPFSLVIQLLIKRARKDREMRKKIVPAVLRLATPRQLAKIIAHITRRTY